VSPALLETERLRLVPWDESHTPMLVRLAALPDVMRYIGHGELLPAAQAEAMSAAVRAHWAEHGFGWRAALEKESGQACGFVAFNFAGDGTARLAADEYELGWWLDPAVWGRGLAHEGALAVRDDAFDSIGAESVVARIQPANARSIAVAESLGLTFDFATTGRAAEAVSVYRLTAPRWREIRRAV
jgi:RimJ/RimL family protein N-acetyltransferase